MGKGFGNLAKIRGIVYFRLSPYEQKAFAGAISHGVPNTIRRIRESALRVGPAMIFTYLVYSWAKQEHERVVRKKPGDFANDV
ncbi:cytochrome b-c1 complex subunit 8 [Diachasma alloeum]|uniref:Cytochrome b-c1 complex subunit 8 n=1 Tax=Diachasma alloeum TaxID=454923 RepID=A0A4E0RJB4_9HYME|nr:cytochrome b-c1 complex subunit 8 [Diachasma alloeum]XP_015108786.1 cytochrome b-c1 complex subunit 8 [Diachasma alloeum]THK32842.1 ubiquinone-binding protein, ubiquinol-cytochrome c reductase [Diachasma alloeum]